MKIQFYLLPLLLFLCGRSQAQNCNSLVVNYNAFESRCVATGSIQVNVAGGSGNYTYKAIGPVTTPATSSSHITGLSAGGYTILVKDMVTGCTRQIENITIPGSYNDPRFQLTKTDVTCANNNGTISVVNQQFGRAPFLYTIIAPSPAGIGQTSSTGSFSGLPGGEYSIRLTDSCGGIQVRKITIEHYSWWIDGVTVNTIGCDSAAVSITVRDNKNNVNTSGNAFNGFQYGYILNGDTTWGTASQFLLHLNSSKTLKIIVKDPCGTIKTYNWTFPLALQPALSNPQISNMACSTFQVSFTASNMSVPLFCLYNGSDDLITCSNTATFSNLPYGTYCIKAFDFCYDTVINKCFTVTKPLPTVGATVNITNRNCSTFTASVTGQQNLINPTYCLYNASNVQISCNSTGVFNNVPYGSYCIRTRDGCTDSVISRCFTTTRLVPTITHTISNANCSTFTVSTGGSNLINPTYCIYDDQGNLITCNSTGVFPGMGHGSYCIRVITCGDTLTRCFTTSVPVPSVGNISVSRQCSTFRATLTGLVNLTNPTFCIYNSSNVQVACNTSGIFDNLPYGSYCIRVQNSCYDTLITRCITVAKLVPSINTSVQILSTTCNTVSFRASGSNLSSPTYCLFNENNVQISCNTTGTFNNVPYGKYCVQITNQCYDTVMTTCFTLTQQRGISLTTSKPCSIGNSYVDVNFASGRSPFNVKVYHPNGALVKDTNAVQNPVRMLLPALPATAQYMVIGRDSCGNRDTAYIVPNANIVTTSTSVKPKCPSAAWLNGSGDILAACSSNHYTVMPKIIKKNGVSFTQNFASVTNNVYSFVDLEPAQYIVEYTQQTCNLKIYDTVTVAPYAYPTQGQSALYQCDNNGFSLGADVSGGVSPYSYQIIGSAPMSPSINTPEQSSPVFNINTGTVYSLVRLRTIDACGNATLSDISVLPLQNISISASDTCFYQNILLKVDTVPNATYYWYKKTSPTDSVLLDSGLTYNMPFFQPEDIGQYVCKMVVNLGCVTRLARFDLFGCTNWVLNSPAELKGKRVGRSNQLTLNHPSGSGVTRYVVERKKKHESGFEAIGTILPKQGATTYYFTDEQSEIAVQYRVKLVTPQEIAYTNVVMLGGTTLDVITYPNPVRSDWQVQISGANGARIRVELLNPSGQVVLKNELKSSSTTLLKFRRDANQPGGIYLLRVTNLDAVTSEIRKLLFE